MENAFLATADGGNNWIRGEISFGVFPRLFYQEKSLWPFLTIKNRNHVFFSHFLGVRVLWTQTILSRLYLICGFSSKRWVIILSGISLSLLLFAIHCTGNLEGDIKEH